MTVPSIGAKSWLQGEAYDAFRAAYEYARNRPQAVPALSQISPEAAYYVWLHIQAGYLQQQRSADAAGAAVFKAVAEDLWGMPSMSGLAWHELAPADRALWMRAADAAVSGHA